MNILTIPTTSVTTTDPSSSSSSSARQDIQHQHHPTVHRVNQQRVVNHRETYALDVVQRKRVLPQQGVSVETKQHQLPPPAVGVCQEQPAVYGQ